MIAMPGMLPAQQPAPPIVEGPAPLPHLAPPPAPAPASPADAVPAEDEHKSGSEKLATRQDELAADIQQLALEQTVQKVIDMLKDCEDTMGEASERLVVHDTGGDTIAAQTEVIEKILDAAKEKQKQGGGSQAGGAMMDMLKQMAGQGEGEPKEGKPGDKPGDKAGYGKTGLSDSANTASAGGGTGEKEQRRIPKAAGTAGKALPEEFRGALDAYNRGADKLAK